MSGFCGVYSPQRPELASPAILARMAATLKHRGRTEQSFADGRGAALWYTYLPSFLAPNERPAPHWFQDDDVVIAVDGTLTDSSLARFGNGAPPEVNADAFAAAQALKQDPSTFPADIDGIFGLAAWDATRRRMILAADRANSMPVFYYADEGLGLLLFASEAKAIYAHPAVKMEVHLESISVYLATSCLPPPLGLVKGVKKMMPGQALSLDAAGVFDHRQYWAFSPAEKRPLKAEEWVPLVREQMQASLQTVTRGTPQLAVNMSGGWDSSLLMAALKDGGVTASEAFTLGRLPARSDSDMYWGERATADLQLPFHPVESPNASLTPEFVMSLLKQFDEPTDMHNASSDFLLARAAAGHGINSSVTGDSGEATFGGTGIWKRLIPRVQSGELKTDDDCINFALRHSVYLDAADQAKMLAPGMPQGDELIDGYVVSYQDVIPRDNAFDFFSTLHYLRTRYKNYANHYMAPLAGVESRIGFGGADLMVFCRSMPNELRGGSETSPGRHVLSSAYTSMVPSVAERHTISGKPATPINWDVVFGGIRLLGETGWFKPAGLEKLQRKFEERPVGRRQSMYMKLWLLFGLQVWLDNYVNKVDPYDHIMRSIS